MKRFSVSYERMVLGAALSVLVAAGSVSAQVRAAGGAAAGAGAGAAGEVTEKVKIQRFPQPGKTSMIYTPEFNANVSGLQPKVNNKRREWALFEIKYSTGQKWTDELAFNYHVMAQGKDEDGRDAYSYYTLAVRYIDIPKGAHMSCVALPPSLVERYGAPVSLALEIMGKDGSVLDSKSETLVPYPSKEWWKDPNVMDKPIVKRRPGLVDRSKTPFALINADDYEVVQ